MSLTDSSGAMGLLVSCPLNFSGLGCILCPRSLLWTGLSLRSPTTSRQIARLTARRAQKFKKSPELNKSTQNHSGDRSAIPRRGIHAPTFIQIWQESWEKLMWILRSHKRHLGLAFVMGTLRVEFLAAVFLPFHVNDSPFSAAKKRSLKTIEGAAQKRTDNGP